MKSSLFVIINKIVNRYIALDPKANQLKKPLEGKSIAIDSFPLHFYIHCNEQITLSSTPPQQIDVTIKGQLFNLWQLMQSTDKASAMKKYQITLVGCTDTAMALQNLCEQLDIDWPEILAPHLGDTVTVALERLVNKIKGASKHIKNTTKDTLSEYLQEELVLIVGKEELNDFTDDIDQLSQDFERLSARIDRLLAYRISEQKNIDSPQKKEH